MFLFALVSWWEQYPDTAIPGTDCSDHRNRESFGLLCVGWPTTVSRFCFILYKFLMREIHSWRRSPAWDETMARQWEGVDEEHSSATTVWNRIHLRASQRQLQRALVDNGSVTFGCGRRLAQERGLQLKFKLQRVKLHIGKRGRVVPVSLRCFDVGLVCFRR